MKIAIGDQFTPKPNRCAKFDIEITKIIDEDFFGFKYLHTGWQGNIPIWDIKNNYDKKQKTLFD